MKLSELIGKRAIRTAPITVQRNESMPYGYGSRYVSIPDYRYCDEAVKVLAATDTNAIVQIESLYDGKSRRRILSCQFCDNNWTDYDELENTIMDEIIQERG